MTISTPFPGAIAAVYGETCSISRKRSVKATAIPRTGRAEMDWGLNEIIDVEAST